jgi:hypothetical protein
MQESGISNFSRWKEKLKTLKEAFTAEHKDQKLIEWKEMLKTLEEDEGNADRGGTYGSDEATEAERQDRK